MSSAAQVSAPRSRTRLSPRSAARLRRMTLRGAAIVYLGAMVALPVAAVITKGFGDGLDGVADGARGPGAVAGDPPHLDHVDARGGDQRGDGHDARLRAGPLPVPRPADAVAIVDLPLAIPTLVTGVMLVALYGPNSLIGGFLDDLGIQVIFTPIAIMLALLVVTLPLVVRSVQPVLQELDTAEEEAAATLGANAWTTFYRIVLAGDPARDRGRHPADLRPVPR